MTPGQSVICIASSGYRLTTGRAYEVVRYEPQVADHNFTWPAYLHVVDDDGKAVVCHAHRFKENMK